MEALIPPNLEIDIKCFVVNEDLNLKSLDNDEVEIAICTSSGELVEFLNKAVVNSYQTQLLKATSLKIFYAYKPFRKFYIIQEDANLLVIEKNKYLKELKLMKNVSKYEISDFLGFGFPQLKLWFNDEMEPMVTDFSNCWSWSDRVDRLPRLQSNLTRMLDKKLQMMNLRLDEATNLHEEKRRCRTRALYQLSSKSNSSSSSDKDSDIYESDAVDVCRRYSAGILKLETPWQKVIEDCWLIGIPVVNSSISEVNDLQLHLISNDGEFKYKCLIFPLNDLGNHSLQISNSMTVPAGSKSVIIGILDIPHFNMKNSFTVTGVVSYNNPKNLCSGFHQMNLPRFILSTNDLVNGSLSPSTISTSVQDIAAMVAASEKTELEIIIAEKKINIGDILSKLHYTEVGDFKTPMCFVNYTMNSGSLAGSIIFWNKVSTNVYNLICHTRSKKQLMLLAHGLLRLLPYKSQVLKRIQSKPNLDRAIFCLNGEIAFLTESLRSGLLPIEGSLPDVCELKFEEKSWREMRQKLFAFELKTDLAFEGLSI